MEEGKNIQVSDSTGINQWCQRSNQSSDADARNDNYHTKKGAAKSACQIIGFPNWITEKQVMSTVPEIPTCRVTEPGHGYQHAKSGYHCYVVIQAVWRVGFDISLTSLS